MLANELSDDARIGERRNVAELILFVCGYFPKYSPHDLSGARLGKAGGPLQGIRRRDRTDFATNPFTEFETQRLGTLDS
jgi:hypothetical protein